MAFYGSHTEEAKQKIRDFMKQRTVSKETRYEINNGITLCHFHHPRKREKEKELSPFFQELILKM